MTLEEHLEKLQKEIDTMTLKRARDIISLSLSHDDNTKFSEAIKMLLDCADKTLKQESVLDKIRAEIEQEIIPRNSDQYDHEAKWQNLGLRMALKVIDKYKLESEDKE